MAVDGPAAKVCALHHLVSCWLAGNNDLLVSTSPIRLSCLLSTCKSLLFGQMLDIYSEENHSIGYFAYIVQVHSMDKGIFNAAQSHGHAPARRVMPLATLLRRSDSCKEPQ